MNNKLFNLKTNSQIFKELSNYSKIKKEYLN